jgi:hypothetical protein
MYVCIYHDKWGVHCCLFEYRKYISEIDQPWSRLNISWKHIRLNLSLV